MSRPSNISFNEVMHGFIGFSAADAQRGWAAGREQHTRLALQLGIRIDDLGRFVGDAQHAARVEGTIVCDALGGELPLENGTFDLFAHTMHQPATLMRYRLFASDSVGHPLTVAGVKLACGADWRSVWLDTTTLYTRVLAGHVPAEAEASAATIAAGIVKIAPLGFLKQLSTMRASGPSRGAGAAAMLRFGIFFGQHVWSAYGRRRARKQHGS